MTFLKSGTRKATSTQHALVTLGKGGPAAGWSTHSWEERVLENPRSWSLQCQRQVPSSLELSTKVLQWDSGLPAPCDATACVEPQTVSVFFNLPLFPKKSSFLKGFKYCCLMIQFRLNLFFLHSQVLAAGKSWRKPQWAAKDTIFPLLEKENKPWITTTTQKAKIIAFLLPARNMNENGNH